MSVSEDEVRRIAALARLKPDDEKLDRLTRDLNRILEHIESLSEADVSGVQEGLRLPEASVPFRSPDLPPDPLDEGAPGDRAPDWREGFFVVPRLPAVEGSEDTPGPGDAG